MSADASQQVFSLDGNMAMAFATPVVSHKWPDSDALNDQLRALILAVEIREKGIKRSNVGGWHSTADLLAWKSPAIGVLRHRIESVTIALTRSFAITRAAARTFKQRTDAWANVSRNGAYNSPHNHPNCLWSGVYYVASGEAAPGHALNGKLELLDPRAGANMVYINDNLLTGRMLVDPIPGLMVVFPAWLMHMVHPFIGGGERISIAFNVLIAEAAPEPPR